MTGTIAQRQNGLHALDLLAPQRALYTEVKRLRRLRTGLLATGAAASMVLALVLTDARAPVGLVTGLGLLLLGLIAGGREQQRRQSAAAVQEELDTYVLALPWNTLLADRPPTDLVACRAARHRREHGDSDLTNWYPPVDETDHGAAVLLCQRVNVSWSAPLHRAWAGVLGAALGAITLAVVLLGLTGVSRRHRSGGGGGGRAAARSGARTRRGAARQPGARPAERPPARRDPAAVARGH